MNKHNQKEPSKRYKIAYISSVNALDKENFSGVSYFLSKALNKYCGDVYYIGPIRSIRDYLIRKISNAINKITKKKHLVGYNPTISKIYGSKFTRILKGADYDFVIGDTSQNVIGFLNTSIPIVYSTDATFKNLHNYYPAFSNLFRFSEHAATKVAQNAADNASLIICTSKWAKRSFIDDYNVPADKVDVIPRGANIDIVPDKNRVLAKKKSDTLRLLFLGREWKRKGYDIAYKAMTHIRSKGIPVQLTAVGCNPPEEYIDNDVTVIPRINKNTKEGQKQFDEIMFNADFFVMPTRAECLAIAICESAAYGLPVITTNTGGVEEIVENGVNGYALDMKATFEEYGEKIIEIYQNEAHYLDLVKNSRKKYDELLNWDAWGIKMKKILDDFYNKSVNP